MISVEQYFDGPPAVIASAPGRVNVLGEHTDYNDGYVLPTAIPPRTLVAMALSADDHCHCYSATLDESVSFPVEGPTPPGFTRYIEGCMRLVEEHGRPVPALRIYVSSEVPMGAGLSSSAALEVATLRALRELLHLAIDDVAIALMAQQAEIRYAGVNCGIMDQMASSLANSSQLLFLDTRTLQRRLLPLPESSELVVIDTGVARSLATSKYNERREECQQAARLLRVPSLRDVTDMAAVERLAYPYRERARHVVSENLRVLEAINHIPAERFGELMNASHASLAFDYEVSIPALDRLSALLREHPSVFGARLTGAGFGGACVALCRAGEASNVAREVLARFNAEGKNGRILVPEPRFCGF